MLIIVGFCRFFVTLAEENRNEIHRRSDYEGSEWRGKMFIIANIHIYITRS